MTSIYKLKCGTGALGVALCLVGMVPPVSAGGHDSLVPASVGIRVVPPIHGDDPAGQGQPDAILRDGTAAFLLSAGELQVQPGLRVLLFAPHPDDEVIGAAGLIQQVLANGGAVRIVFVTNGDGYVDAVRDAVQRRTVSGADFVAYGERRHDEALKAAGRLGLRRDDVRFLGFPDDGIDDLWSANWSESRPYTSPHTRFNHPPYRDSRVPDVEYAGVDLETEIRGEIKSWRPDWIVAPDPRDSHPDHCTTGVFVLDALRQLYKQSPKTPSPRLLGYLVHAPDYPASARWVSRIAHAGVGGSSTARHSLDDTVWLRLQLNSTQRDQKREAMSAYETQMHVMSPFLNQFLRGDELFSQLDEAQIQDVPREYAARFGRKR